MKLVDIKIKRNNEVEMLVHPVLKAMGLFYIGISMAHLSLRKEAEAVFSDIMLIILAVLGGGFMMYGVIVFIKNVRESKTWRGVVEKIKQNIKKAFK